MFVHSYFFLFKDLVCVFVNLCLRICLRANIFIYANPCKYVNIGVCVCSCGMHTLVSAKYVYTSTYTKYLKSSI